MENFEISKYLRDYCYSTGKGFCKKCDKGIHWARESVRGHKRKACPNSTDEERAFFEELTRLKKSKPNNSFTLDNSDLDVSSNELSDDQRKTIDEAIGNFFFRTGIAFRLADSEAFINMIKQLNPTYAKGSMVNSKKISGPLLDAQYDNIKHKLFNMMKDQTNLILISDGWTNVRCEHIVNFCIKAPDQHTIFYKSVCTKGIVQDAEGVAKAICEVIDELGPQKFSQVITDNAPVMQAAWRIIEETYSNITANGCSAHGMNLLLKDISKFPQNQEVIKKNEKISQFVRNHHIVKAKYDSKRAELGITTTIKAPVATRWYSLSLCAQSLLKSKYVLMSLAENDYDELKEVGEKSKSIAALNMMKSQEFWNKLKKLADILKAPSDSIAKLEADNSSLAFAYEEFGKLYNHFQGQENQSIRSKIIERKDFMISDAMKLAYILTPKFAAEGFYFEGDHEKFINLVEDYSNVKYPEISEDVKNQMINFVTQMSSLTHDLHRLYFSMTARQYWHSFGRNKYPKLFIIAKPIVEMISSSASSERVWSIFKFIHSRLRNRLSDEKLDKLISIYINCAIFDETDKKDYFYEEHLVLNTDENDQ